jgi:hypothetical protein
MTRRRGCPGPGLPRLARRRRWGGSTPSVRSLRQARAAAAIRSGRPLSRQGAGGVTDVDAVGALVEHPAGVGIVPRGERREVQGEGDAPALAGPEAHLGVRFEPLRRLVRGRIGASTGAASTLPRRSRHSASGCATSSTWTCSQPSFSRSWTRQCSPLQFLCGSSHQFRSGQGLEKKAARLTPTELDPLHAI